MYRTPPRQQMVLPLVLVPPSQRMGWGGVAIGSRRHDPNTGAVLNGAPNGGATVNAINGIAIGPGAKAGTAGQNDVRTVAIGDLISVGGS
ncbi:hypothetical protein, partial [Salmonella enterica]|uniref:hypothetical protein n=1 Tax=Salmonella enterica TaxID=28901 RepID=UPI003D19FF19